MIASKDDPTSIVEGLLVFGHSLMDRFRLDQFEGSVSPFSLSVPLFRFTVLSHITQTCHPHCGHL